jgi:3D (Asp-Asp-Asp) domain-containing protein
MDGWIAKWRQKNSRRRPLWPWLLVAVLLLFTGTGWGVMNYAWKQVTLEVDGRQVTARTFAGQVGQFLDEQQIVLGPADVVIPDRETPVTKDMIVTVQRAVPIKVIADGQEKEILTPPATVAAVLSKAGLTLGAADRVTPAIDATAGAGASIRVTRVTFKDETISKELAYRVERRPDGEMEKGITRTLQKGQQGLQEETYRIVYEDGQEVKRELAATKVVKEPRPEIIAVGALETASRGGRSFRFERTFMAVATAYTHSGFRTATGVYPQVGTIAVDPAVVPLGTRLYVEGYGFGVAQDVGSAIKGNRIDVFLDTEAATSRWGVRRVKVYVLE